MSASFSVARVSRDDEAKLPQIRHGWHRREYGEGGGGSGLRETAADESRKETADRVAKYQTDYLGRTCPSMLLVLLRLPRVLFVVLQFSGPFLSLLVELRLCYFVLFCLSHLRGEHDTSFYLFILFLFVSCLFRSFSLPLHCLLYLLHYNVVSVSSFCDCRACVSRRKNRHGHWVCWMSTGRKNGLM